MATSYEYFSTVNDCDTIDTLRQDYTTDCYSASGWPSFEDNQEQHPIDSTKLQYDCGITENISENFQHADNSDEFCSEEFGANKVMTGDGIAITTLNEDTCPMDSESNLNTRNSSQEFTEFLQSTNSQFNIHQCVGFASENWQRNLPRTYFIEPKPVVQLKMEVRNKISLHEISLQKSSGEFVRHKSKVEKEKASGNEPTCGNNEGKCLNKCML